MKTITDKANTAAASNEYPYGDIRDKTVSDAGTPVNQDVYTDMHQFFQRLFDVSGTQPNGETENAVNGFQIMNALGRYVSNIIKPSVFEGFDSVDVESAFDYDWRDVCYGGGYFIRVGFKGGTGAIARTKDGVFHELIYTEVGREFEGIAYGGDGRFMVIDKTGTGVALYTTDFGDNWSVQAGILSSDIRRIAYDPDLDRWGVVDVNGNFFLSLDNGASFSSFNLPNYGFLGIAYGNGYFCCSGANLISNDSNLAFTQDGTSFTTPNHGALNLGSFFSDVVYDTVKGNYFGYAGADSAQKGFIAISLSGAGIKAYTAFGDENGVSVTEMPNIEDQYSNLAYGNGKIMAIGFDNLAAPIVDQSFDLSKNVEQLTDILTGSINSIAYGDGKFLICGDRTRTPII